MKKIFLLFFIISTFSQTTKADTIDVWHVYFNGVKIKEFNHYGKNIITLKLDSLKIGDSITIKYFRDTPCRDCVTHLNVEDGKHHVLLNSQGKGTFNPISFSLNNLIELRKQGYTQDLEIFYFEGYLKTKSDKNLIFRIRIE